MSTARSRGGVGWQQSAPVSGGLIAASSPGHHRVFRTLDKPVSCSTWEPSGWWTTTAAPSSGGSRMTASAPSGPQAGCLGSGTATYNVYRRGEIRSQTLRQPSGRKHSTRPEETTIYSLFWSLLIQSNTTQTTTRHPPRRAIMMSLVRRPIMPPRQAALSPIITPARQVRNCSSEKSASPTPSWIHSNRENTLLK